MTRRPDEIELTTTTVALASRTVTVVHARDATELIDEERFERDEFLPYWAELWPSAVVLARALAELPLAGKRVVELGCGVGLPSIAAALAGARVLATDWAPEALDHARANAARNGAALETALVAWNEPAELVARGPWDVMLASDVLYENRNVPLLADLLPQLVDRRGVVLFADPGRPAAAAFIASASPAWTIRELEADDEHPRVGVHELRRR